MKNFKNITGILVLSIALLSCNDNSTETESDNSKDGTTTTKSNIKKTRNSEGLVIAYYVQDSISTGFNFYREIDSMLKSKERGFERELRGKYENYQRYEDNIRKKMDAGEITGYQLEEIQQEAMQKQERIATFERQRGAELQKESMNYQNALMNKISEAGREFSEEHNLDMLFFYQKGGQITYISNAFDVTEDFIAFLNKREEEIMTGVEKEMEDHEGDDDETVGLQGLNK